MSDKVSIFAGTALHKGFATDHDAERKGVWRTHHESGIHVRIRRSTLPEHKRALRKHYKPFAHLPQLDPVQELLVKQKAAAETLVADWGIRIVDSETGAETIEPLRDAEGSTIQPSQDNILQSFIEMPDFFRWVSEEADTWEHYRIEAVKESTGNSPPTSDGTTNGAPPSSSLSLSEEVPAAIASKPSSVDPS